MTLASGVGLEFMRDRASLQSRGGLGGRETGREESAPPCGKRAGRLPACGPSGPDRVPPRLESRPYHADSTGRPGPSSRPGERNEPKQCRTRLSGESEYAPRASRPPHRRARRRFRKTESQFMSDTPDFKQIQTLLGDKAKDLLEHQSKTIARERLHLPGPDFIDRVFALSDRNPQTLRNLQSLFGSGRLAGTGYLSILPVDQGIEHSAGASFAKNPAYFDPENIVKLAIEGGCNAVASTFGVLGSVARKYAHKIPFIVKFNHNELLTYPNKAEQIT